MSRFLKHTLRCVVFLAVLALLLTGVSQLVRPKNNTRSDGIHDPRPTAFSENRTTRSTCSSSVTARAIPPSSDAAVAAIRLHGLLLRHVQTDTVLFGSVLAQSLPEAVAQACDPGDRCDLHRLSYGSMLLQEAGDLFPVFSYHDRWKSLKANDWRMTVNYTHTENAKGYQLRCNATPADASNYMTPSDAYAPIPKRNRAYVERIKAFCDENGAQLMLVSTPSTVNWNMARHNSTQALADKLQIPFIDFNTMSDQVSINWSTDTRDQGDHLNYFGAKKSNGCARRLSV